MASGGTSLEVSITQSGSSGNGWTSSTFYPLVTDDPISPYTHRRNFYPTTLGQDGVLSASAVLTLRKTGTSETATVTFTPTNTPGNTPNTLTVSGGSGGTTTPPGNLPPYAQNLNPAYTYNDQNRGFTVYANPGGNQVEVAVSQQYASGQSASGDGWQSDSYVALVPQSTQSGYTHKRDFNASTASNGIVTTADMSVLFRQVDGPAGTSPVAISSFRVVPRITPGTFPGPLRPYTPPSPIYPGLRPPYPPLSSFTTAGRNNSN